MGKEIKEKMISQASSSKKPSKKIHQEQASKEIRKLVIPEDSNDKLDIATLESHYQNGKLIKGFNHENGTYFGEFLIGLADYLKNHEPSRWQEIFIQSADDLENSSIKTGNSTRLPNKLLKFRHLKDFFKNYNIPFDTQSTPRAILTKVLKRKGKDKDLIENLDPAEGLCCDIVCGFLVKLLHAKLGYRISDEVRRKMLSDYPVDVYLNYTKKLHPIWSEKLILEHGEGYPYAIHPDAPNPRETHAEIFVGTEDESIEEIVIEEQEKFKPTKAYRKMLTKSKLDDILSTDDKISKLKETKLIILNDIKVHENQILELQEQVAEMDKEIAELQEKKEHDEADTVVAERMREIVTLEDQEQFKVVSLILVEIGGAFLKPFLIPGQEIDTVAMRTYARDLVIQSEIGEQGQSQTDTQNQNLMKVPLNLPITAPKERVNISSIDPSKTKKSSKSGVHSAPEITSMPEPGTSNNPIALTDSSNKKSAPNPDFDPFSKKAHDLNKASKSLKALLNKRKSSQEIKEIDKKRKFASIHDILDDDNRSTSEDDEDESGDDETKEVNKDNMDNVDDFESGEIE